jgi:uncharacterized protein YcbX
VRSTVRRSISGRRGVSSGAKGGVAVGTVAELWRFPVKSMLGSAVDELLITESGALGDRAWALRDLKTGRIASAKKFPGLLEFRARYETQPTATSHGRVTIEAPDGRLLEAEEPEASATISEILERDVRLENQPAEDEKTGIDRETVFGDVGVHEMKPEWTPETMPDYFQLKRGSFLEIGSVYLVSSGSIAHLRELQGGTAQIDRRRFRPNIYVDSGEASAGFVEDAWLGRALAIGEELELDGFDETLWCVTSTLAQEELPRDLSILRATAQHHRGCLGVYANVRSPGRACVGDPIKLLR